MIHTAFRLKKTMLERLTLMKPPIVPTDLKIPSARRALAFWCLNILRRKLVLDGADNMRGDFRSIKLVFELDAGAGSQQSLQK